MHKFKHIFSGMSLSILMGSIICTNTAYALPPTYTDPQKSIFVTQKNPEFTLSLPANPTTGYSWFAKNYNTQFITIVKHTYQAPQTRLVGAGGIDVWTFKITQAALAAPHILKIDLLYARPWNIEDNSKELEFTVVTHD